MSQLEELIDEACSLGIVVDDDILPEDCRFDGLYLHWNHRNISAILLNRHRPQSVQYTAMAEELGHFYTCVGNVLDQSDTVSRKIESAGRCDAYNRILPAQRLQAALEQGAYSLYDLSANLNIPEGFILDAYHYYIRKGIIHDADLSCYWCCVS